MLDFPAIGKGIAKHTGGMPSLLCALYSLPRSVMTMICGMSGGVSWVFDQPSQMLEDSLCGGWWVGGNRERWCLRRAQTQTVVLIGVAPEQDLSGGLLLEALLKGFREMLLIDNAGELIKAIDLFSCLSDRLNLSANVELDRPTTYAAALAEMSEVVGDQLILSPSDFERKRVLMLIGSLGPGGAERQVAYTARGLVARGWDVVVGCNFLDPPHDFLRAEVEKGGGRVILVPPSSPTFESETVLHIRGHLEKFDALRINWGVFHAAYHYALVMRDIRPSLVHTWLDYTNVCGGFAAKWVGVPKLLMGGRSVAPDNFPALYQPYMRPGYKLVLKSPRVSIVNNSHAGARDYERWLDLEAGSIGVIHNGFDFSETSSVEAGARIRQSLNIKISTPVVGTISRFSEEKNPLLFIEMAQSILGYMPDTRFVMYGTGVLFGETKRHVEQLGLSDVIRLLGPTPSPWPVLSAMDVFVLTSRMEGLSNVLVEAQAAGLPVVCTGVGGMPETYIEGKTGFGVADATGERLADVVVRLLKKRPTLEMMGRWATEHARREFGLDTMIDRTVDTYARGRPVNFIASCD